MIEQISTAVVFYAFFVGSKVGKTGLTVTVDVYRAGTEIVAGGNATEIGDGIYCYTLAGASVTVEGEYVAVFKTADSTVDQQHIPAIWSVGRAGVEHLDADVADVPDAVWDEALAGHATAGTAGAALSAAGSAADPLLNEVPGSYASGTAGAALGRIGTADITIVSPVADDGAITLIYGDDYLSSDNRALDFTGTTWPVITGATIALKVRSLSFAGSVLAADECRVELTAAQVESIGPGAWAYDLQATLSNGHVVTLAQSTLTVTTDVR
jgi:hypothetical protein